MPEFFSEVKPPAGAQQEGFEISIDLWEKIYSQAWILRERPARAVLESIAFLRKEGCIRFGLLGFGWGGLVRRTSVACREADSSQSIALWVDGDLWSFPSPLFGSKLSIFSVAGGMAKKSVLKRPSAASTKWTPQGTQETWVKGTFEVTHCVS
eukprot:g20528.t1